MCFQDPTGEAIADCDKYVLRYYRILLKLVSQESVVEGCETLWSDVEDSEVLRSVMVICEAL